MFGLGMGELVIIAIVALLVLGPDKLPDAAKSLSKGIRDFRRHSKDLQRTIEDDEQIGGAIRDLKSALRGEDLYVPPHLNRDAMDDVDEDAHHGVNDWDTPVGDAEAESKSAASDDDSSDDASKAGAADEPAPGEHDQHDDDDEDIPVIRPASGAVAKNEAEPLTPTPATAPAADDAHG